MNIENKLSPFTSAMGKALLMGLLAVVSSSAVAKWVEIGGNESATAYADLATIEKAGNLVKMWDLLDFKVVQARPYGTPYRSQKTRQEYDCKAERARILDVELPPHVRARRDFLRKQQHGGGGRDHGSESGVGAEDEHSRRTEDRVADQAQDRRVQTGDRGEAGQLCVRHPLRHEES